MVNWFIKQFNKLKEWIKRRFKKKKKHLYEIHFRANYNSPKKQMKSIEIEIKLEIVAYILPEFDFIMEETYKKISAGDYTTKTAFKDFHDQIIDSLEFPIDESMMYVDSAGETEEKYDRFDVIVNAYKHK